VDSLRLGVQFSGIGSVFGNGSPRCNLFPDSVLQASLFFSPHGV